MVNIIVFVCRCNVSVTMQQNDSKPSKWLNSNTFFISIRFNVYMHYLTTWWDLANIEIIAFCSCELQLINIIIECHFSHNTDRLRVWLYEWSQHNVIRAVWCRNVCRSVYYTHMASWIRVGYHRVNCDDTLRQLRVFAHPINSGHMHRKPPRFLSAPEYLTSLRTANFRRSTSSL